MLTAIALDDEPRALRVVSLLAAKVPYLDLQATFTTPREALAYLRAHPVDVLFVDVRMPDITGVDFVRALPRRPLIIFTTAYSDYAVQGFDLDAVDYLLKPFSLERFQKACAKAQQLKTAAGAEARPSLLVKTGYEEEKLLLDELLYVEADGNYLTLVLPGRRVLTRQTMAELLRQLPPDGFLRVHRSYIVAVQKVEKLARHEVTVAGTVIPVGVSYEGAVEQIRASLAARP